MAGKEAERRAECQRRKEEAPEMAKTYQEKGTREECQLQEQQEMTGETREERGDCRIPVLSVVSTLVLSVGEPVPPRCLRPQWRLLWRLQWRLQSSVVAATRVDGGGGDG